MGYTITPLSPIYEVYYALRSITCPDTGIQDLDKILLQVSFDSVQWKLQEGQVINRYPYNPSYDAIYQRLTTGEVTLNYSDLNRNPYATFYDERTILYNVLWYEDSKHKEKRFHENVWSPGNFVVEIRHYSTMKTKFAP